MDKKNISMGTGIVILNYNNAVDTINCIESVMENNTAKIKIVLVDNGSPNKKVIEELADYISKRFHQNSLIAKEGEQIPQTLPFFTFLISETNDGYASGNNKGLKLVYEDDSLQQVMILNNDILFVEDIIPQLTYYLETLPNAAIVSPLLLKKDGIDIDFNCARTNVRVKEMTKLFFLSAFNIRYNKMEEHKMLVSNPSLLKKDFFEVELPSGSCMLLKKEFFKSIKSFDPKTFLYYEENILYRKICLALKKNYLCPQLKCIHLGASTTKKMVRSYNYIKMSNKSSKYYVENYADCSLLQKQLFIFSQQLYLWKELLCCKLKGI